MSRYRDDSDSDRDHRLGVGISFRHGHGHTQATPAMPPARHVPYFMDNSGAHISSGALVIPSGHRRGSSRSRSRERRSVTPSYASQAPTPVVINNTITNQDDLYSNSEDSEEDRRDRRRHKSKSRKKSRRRGRSRSASSYSSSSRSRSRSRHYHSRVQSQAQDPTDKNNFSREEWEMEILRRQIEQLETNNEAAAAAAHTKKERDRILEQAKHDEEIRRLKDTLARKKLEDVKAKEEEDLKSKWELEQKKADEEKAEEEKRLAEIREATIKKYELEIKEAAEKERREKEEFENQYRAKLSEDLIAAGVDERDIAAILNKEKVPSKLEEEEEEERLKRKDEIQDALEYQKLHLHRPPQHMMPQIAHHIMSQPQQSPPQQQVMVPYQPVPTTTVAQARPTYTRMSRRHLSFEALSQFDIEYELDQDPDYVVIKRWVPEWEQDALWELTKSIRESRKKPLFIEENRHRRHHHHHHLLPEPKLEVVRSRSKSRTRSKSPSPALLYLAGRR